MKRAPRKTVIHVAQFLMRQHGDEWARGRGAAVAYFIRPEEGAYVVLRDSAIMRRLASARILLTVPKTEAEWHELRLAMRKRGWGPETVWHAKYSYVVVSDRDRQVAVRAFRGTRIKVLSNTALERTAKRGRSAPRR